MALRRLRHRVTIEEKQETPDGAGGFSVAWVAVHNRIPAAVRGLSTREKVQAGQLEASGTYEVVIRRRSNVAENQRLMWDGLSMNIRGVTPDERQRWLTLICEAGVAV